MKKMILALALMVPGVSMAADVTCTVNSNTVSLEEYSNPNADIVAYRYQQNDNGTFLSIMYVDGAYDLYIKNGKSSLTQTRQETLNLNLTFGGKDLSIVCP